ncbi:M48 family metallopeptidase [Sphingomonas sinipercae]|uniref:M48 family metallopeptidase n=1 Tax=Sphingomonas sinipercae TaxID=2714944 RepID=A0A6G7ZKV0_9SPHN|nr:YgjP-like metallopeptidase domain-containing protein [Sphingomonas sinipercae]QIL01545.1 M48 family metallopeptidase [Sphingomonas sinipercae]
MNIIWSTVASERLERHPDLPAPILLSPLRSARRMRLRYDAARHLLKVTYPRGLSRRAVLSWATGHRDWIDRQITEAPAAEPFAPGATIPIDGADVLLVQVEGAGRSPLLAEGRLVVGGPASAFPGRIERFLKRLALETLSRETAEVAARAGIAPASVGIGDAATRWGSCSSARRIRYSWRLILAPAEARQFVVAHEVAHLIELNHGPKFKQVERDLFGGDVAEARALLRAWGPRLKGIGRRG